MSPEEIIAYFERAANGEGLETIRETWGVFSNLEKLRYCFFVTAESEVDPSIDSLDHPTVLRERDLYAQWFGLLVNLVGQRLLSLLSVLV